MSPDYLSWADHAARVWEAVSKPFRSCPGSRQCGTRGLLQVLYNKKGAPVFHISSSVLLKLGVIRYWGRQRRKPRISMRSFLWGALHGYPRCVQGKQTIAPFNVQGIEVPKKASLCIPNLLFLVPSLIAIFCHTGSWIIAWFLRKGAEHQRWCGWGYCGWCCHSRYVRIRE